MILGVGVRLYSANETEVSRKKIRTPERQVGQALTEGAERGRCGVRRTWGVRLCEELR